MFEKNRRVSKKNLEGPFGDFSVGFQRVSDLEREESFQKYLFLYYFKKNSKNYYYININLNMTICNDMIFL